MGSLVSLFIVLAALVTMVGVMYLVLTEKHTDESKINYVQSPYPQPPAVPVEPPPAPAEKAADHVDSITPDVTAESVEAAVTSVAESVDAGAGQPVTPAADDESDATEGRPEA